MRCPVCVEQGLTSVVHVPQGGYSTLMAGVSYYDKEGAYHHHDPNSHTATYSCSNGHRWRRVTYNRCLNCDYNEERDSILVLAEDA